MDIAKTVATKTLLLNTLTTLAMVSALFTPLFVNAETLPKSHNSQFEELWKFADLYETKTGDYLKLSGRLQLDSTWVNSKEGEFNDTLWRRFRFGFKGRQDDFTAQLEADINLNNALSDAYNRLTDANISWSATPETSIKVLKQSAGFTLDGKTSSKKLLTAQRNNLTNNLWFTAEYFTGVSIKSTLSESTSYKAGMFSSDGSDEIGFTDASYFALLSSTTKLSTNTLWDKAIFSFDYVYNDTHKEGNTRDFSQVISTSSQFVKSVWGLNSDISWGKGDLGQSDLFGLVLMPTYQTNPSLQWVARYTFLTSNENNGVRLGKYENKVVTDRGDQYQEAYLGLNWFVNKHKLKLQAGLQYAEMQDSAKDGGEYQGWQLALAMRSYW